MNRDLLLGALAIFTIVLGLVFFQGAYIPYFLEPYINYIFWAWAVLEIGILLIWAFGK